MRPSLGISCCFLLALQTPTLAQTSGPIRFAWPHKNETLIYQSRGCADGCWEATVRAKSSRVLRARLQCDGYTLTYYQPTAHPSRLTLSDCDQINRSDEKFDSITAIIEAQLHAPTKKRSQARDGIR